MSAMKTFLCAAVALCLLGLAPSASAAITGAELLQRCSASEKSLDSGEKLSANEALDAMWCMGYLSGLLDGFSINDYSVAGARVMCPPEDGLTRTQALRIVTKWLREHPEAQQKNGRRDALLALSTAYPCK